MILHANSVGKGSAQLVIYVNNSKHLDMPLPDKDSKGDEVANEYNIDVVLELGPGSYEIKIDNDEVDWFTWDYIVFENAVYAKAKVQVIGLSNKTFAMLWIRNRDYNWWNIVVADRDVETLKNVTIELIGLEEGKYVVEFWNTTTGEIVQMQKSLLQTIKLRYV